MSERFEDISRQLAGTTSRRGVLKMFGAAAGAAVVANVLKPFRGSAGAVCGGAGVVQPAPCAAGQTPCGPCCCIKELEPFLPRLRLLRLKRQPFDRLNELVLQVQLALPGNRVGQSRFDLLDLRGHRATDPG